MKIMKASRTTTFTKVVSLILVLTLFCPIIASAAVIEPSQPNASYYLTSYGAYIGPLGGGQVKVYFSVTGTTEMEMIGATRVVLYESSDNSNWSIVGNYHYSTTSGMMGYGYTRYSSSTPTYYGTAGYYYQAYVTIWAGNGTDGDSRSFWTSVKQAT